MPRIPEKTERNKEIYKLSKLGATQAEMGRKYGISYQRVARIILAEKKKEAKLNEDIY